MPTLVQALFLAVLTRQGPLEFTASPRGMTRNKKTNKGTRSLQIVLSAMKRGKEKNKTARDNQWWLQMYRSRESQRKWHLSWDLNGRKESGPCKLEGRVFLAVNFLEQSPSRGNAPGIFSRSNEKAQNKDSHISSTSSPCEHTAFKKVVLNPSNPDPYLF